MTRPYPCHHPIDYYDKKITVAQLSEITGICTRTLLDRHNRQKLRGEAVWALERGNAKRKEDADDVTVRGWLAARREERERRRDREFAKREQLKAELMALRQVRFA